MNRASDNHDYDFGPFEDDYRGFEPRDGEGNRGPLIVALAGGLLLIFGAVIWNTYKEGVRVDAGALPIIFADATPYKRAPENPGGTVAPDQDRVIYDQLDGGKRQLAALAEPEQIKPEPVLPQPILQGGPPIMLREGEETDLDEASGIPKAALRQVIEMENRAKAEQAKIENVAVTAAPAAEPRLNLPSSKFTFEASGNYLVQIAALRTEAAADAAWLSAVGEHPAIYNGAQKRVQRADLGAKGVFYRLRVGAFGERPEAVSFCDALKSQGETCIVVNG